MEEFGEERKRPDLKSQAMVIGVMVLFLWLIEIVDLLPFVNLDGYGVRPRTLPGLWGILAAPFLHYGFGHLAANTVPLALLSWLVMLRSYREWAFVLLLAAVGSGVGTWIVAGPNTVHIGSSGLVFGLFGFLLGRALFERSLRAISAALVVIMLYGSLIWGVLPLIQGVSWQMHLFGFLAGLLGAWLLPVPLEEEEDDESSIVILNPDQYYWHSGERDDR